MTQPAGSGPDRPFGGALRLWLDAVPRPGWRNMAIDQALLDLAAGEGLAVLRLYQWQPHCLSFGRHEPARRRYDRSRIEALGLDVVRRPTGGRAVWHARELTYAIAAPGGLGSLRQTYGAVHVMLVDALRRLGAPADLAAPPPRTPGPADGACFAAPVGGEVVVSGRKVVGSAQVRQGDAFLQHGSILLQDDQGLIRVLSNDTDGPGGEIPLSEALGRPVGFVEAASAVVTAAEQWAGPLAPFEASVALGVAERHENRFRAAAWTWER